MTSLVWLRRDLRLDDHAALSTALASPAPVQLVFVFDTDILAHFSHPSDRRLRFLAEALCGIHRTLRQRGGGLLLLHGSARDVIPKLAAAVGATQLICAEDFEPEPMARDSAVGASLPSHTRFVQVIDHVLRTPLQMRKKDGTPFKVFTPCYKQWLASLSPMDWAPYTVQDAGRYADFFQQSACVEGAGLRRLDPDGGADALLRVLGYCAAEDPLWPVDPRAISGQLDLFVDEKIARYGTGRDMLAQRGTSRLSPYLRHGLISVRALLRAVEGKLGAERWISELCWREFYMSILYHFPEVQTQEFQPHYRDGAITWNRSHAAIAALHEGRTGYPVIDAALQELLQTGWMHNRARMIVAAFFTKDLLLDWRIGEAFFAQYLMDYELASNNGGWQWAASTGTDAAPYFRVFNPDLQSAKFDPDGEYIRRYLPQLSQVPTAALHRAGEAARFCSAYPPPLVDHAQAKERAVAVFKRVKS